MKKKMFCAVVLVLMLVFGCLYKADAKAKDTGLTVSNGLFSLNLSSEDAVGIYTPEIKKDAIIIYDTYSKDRGFGGLAFGVKAYKNPADYASAPGVRKLGELIKNDRVVYDIVLIQPTDVQFDYVNKNNKTYTILYTIGELIDKEIKGKKGYEFVYGSGMHGKELYKDIIKKHEKAIKEKWDSNKLEKENMSVMHNVIRASGQDPARKMGYCFYDINSDGIDELLIGDTITKTIYDMYTMANRKPIHVVSGWDRNRYYACDREFVCQEYSNSAFESGMNVYILTPNSSELYPQVYFKYDLEKNKKNPYFISYGPNEEDFENVSKEKYFERKKIFDDYVDLEFAPFKM